MVRTENTTMTPYKSEWWMRFLPPRQLRARLEAEMTPLEAKIAQIEADIATLEVTLRDLREGLEEEQRDLRDRLADETAIDLGACEAGGQ